MKYMENRKTAMQELFDNLESIDVKVPIGVKEIFLEKEKEQIIQAYYQNGWNDNDNEHNAEQYYNETYKQD